MEITVDNTFFTIFKIFLDKNIPNEIIFKILYEFKGLEHPISQQIKYYRHNLQIGIKQAVRFLGLRYSLRRSVDIIKNIKCHVCDTKRSYTGNDRSQYKYEDKSAYLSSTQALMNLENLYGPNFDKYLCKTCISIYFENTGNVIIY